jgi:hypothetical protein
MVLQEILELQVLLEPQAQMVLQVTQGLLEQLEQMEQMVQMELLAIQVIQEPQAQMVLQVIQVLQELLEQMVQMELLAQASPLLVPQVRCSSTMEML